VDELIVRRYYASASPSVTKPYLRQREPSGWRPLAPQDCVGSCQKTALRRPRLFFGALSATADAVAWISNGSTAASFCSPRLCSVDVAILFVWEDRPLPQGVFCRRPFPGDDGPSIRSSASDLRRTPAAVSPRPSSNLGDELGDKLSFMLLLERKHVGSRLPKWLIEMAERGGFEPPVRFYPYNGLANRPFRPLRHLSVSGTSIQRPTPFKGKAVFGRCVPPGRSGRRRLVLALPCRFLPGNSANLIKGVR
jgi:hypothetical protein